MSIHNQQTVLVIGATGNIGSALVRELLTDPGPDNVKVRAIVRRPEATESLRRLGVETAFLDLAEIERLPLARNKPLLDALAGVDRLFLLTGYTVQMLAQSKAVIDAAKLAGVRHIVDLSAWATNDTTSAHHGWYQFVERYIEWTGVGFTHLRPNVFMQNILKSLQADGSIHHFLGDATVSWIDTDDIGLIAATILRSPRKHHGKTYPLAVESKSMSEVADVLSKVIGRPFRYMPHSPDEFLAMGLEGGMEQALTGEQTCYLATRTP